MINKQFDEKVNRVIGMEKDEAAKHLESCGYSMRITIEDNQSYMVKGDINMKRVNVIVDRGIVTNIDKIG